MSNHDFIIDNMTWSFSRIKSFSDCRYAWYLKYLACVEDKDMFFSNYGSFMHTILEMYLTNKLTKNELVDYYISNFMENIGKDSPNLKLYQNYFQQGMTYLQNINMEYKNILAVEKCVSFSINQYNFTGYIDLITNDNGISIVDHKSKDLKPRSNKIIQTKTDIELDKYLTQLYLYSIPIKEMFGEYPSFLEFNCFRSNAIIKEEFKIEKLIETKQQILDDIGNIRNNSDWKPSPEEWKCKYICGVCDSCEYKNLL